MSAGIRAGVANDGYIQVNGVDVISLTTSSVAFNGQVFGLQPTGMFATFMLPSTPAGWIAGDGSTIGNTGSGATRANADTQALFTAWWAYSDAQLPILTSAGGASTRGASALADWTANKRLTVFDVRDRVARASGTLQVNGTKLEDAFQSHFHTAAINNFSAGPPTDAYNLSSAGVAAGTGNGVVGANSFVGTVSITATNVIADNGAGGVPRLAAETRVKSIGMLGCFKL